MSRFAASTAAIAAALCVSHAAQADLRIYKLDGTEAAQAEASTTFDSNTGGWNIELKRLYNEGGFTQYDIRGDGGEIIDNIYIDTPCWEAFGECVKAGSPTVVRVESHDPLGISTVRNIEQRTDGEVLLNFVEVREDLGSVTVEAIGDLRVGRDVIGPIIATTEDNRARGIARVFADRDVLGDVKAENGRISMIWAKGDIGKPGAPVEITAKHMLNRVIANNDIDAQINSRANGGQGGIAALYARDFRGTLDTERIRSDLWTDEPGYIWFITQFQGTITIGESYDDAEQFIEFPLAGLDGQVIINANNRPNGTWAAPVFVGHVGHETQLELDSPGYTSPAPMLGGGAIGLVPFDVHRESCAPASGASVLSPAMPLEVRLRHYGPITTAPGSPVTVMRTAIAGGSPQPYFGFTSFIDPKDANSIVVTGLTAGFTYELDATPNLRCDTTGQPPVVWTQPYSVTVEGAAPPTCAADLNQNGMVDFPDLLLLISMWGDSGATSADLDGNELVDFTDLLMLISAWGPCSG